ncbi:hypothetical protein GWI33_020386 [Rhynchophorus ferrugineus]|uniref:Uncharacterized protein n=1 Tax=Rhynchophorus ferrugineus TaxID=354439 RepID=A0A834HRT5_RHYFE|nr:hypothetical protein GWI33_020386 [Rhynchophorus ferrugineus]
MCIIRKVFFGLPSWYHYLRYCHDEITFHTGASFVMTDAGYRHPNEIAVPHRSVPYNVYPARAQHEVKAGAWENQMWERVGGQN